MKIDKIIVVDEKTGEAAEFVVKDGAGIFITDGDQRLILPSANDSLNLEVIRSALSKWDLGSGTNSTENTEENIGQ